MLPEVVTALAGVAFVHHHFAYPWTLKKLADQQRDGARSIAAALLADHDLPRISLIVPAHNEAAVIVRKIENCARIDYPHDKIDIAIACDGCTDATVALARAAVFQFGCTDRISIVELPVNIGKIAVLNQLVPAATGSIIALSDASALIEPDALRRAAGHFTDASVGVVCPTYKLGAHGSEGERAYWSYQIAIKAGESALGAPIGAHGAFYLFRSSGWQPLPTDTINDDVIVPMRIVAAGARAVYDTSIAATEIEPTSNAQDWRRRVRIGAGNMQQVIRLMALVNPARPGIAFAFLSGKFLRVLIPFLVIAAEIAMFASALAGNGVMQALAGLQAAVLLVALAGLYSTSRQVSRPAAWLFYLIKGYAASFLGAAGYLAGGKKTPWRRVMVTSSVDAHLNTSSPDHGLTYVPRAVAISKRVVDIVCALGALVVMVILFIPIALAIKFESRGPIFYRQLRVGRVTPTATHLFHLIKFRTMRADAETKSGAVWATKGDPRVTRVGNFMRKTRLDELPQCINVLRGEMSVIGPRPERPGFFNKLEDAIPFYAERTYGLKPGITGLAQVNQAYDTCIEDVRNKVLFDHAYAARLTTWKEWFRTDFGIVFKTFAVMALGKGQ